MVIRLMFIMAMLMSFASHAVTQLTASVDKNPVMLNESFVLTVTADARLSASALDFDTLNQSFYVQQIRPSSQTQIINSDIRHSSTWSVLMLPRNEGSFTIPAFTIDNVSTQPITMQVIPVSQTNDNKAQEVFLETSVDKSSVYLQSSIVYTSKLYLSLDFQRGSLTEPKMENANISQISSKQDQESSEIRNGVRYRVITRVYSITPQRSGKYKITPPLFNGELVLQRRRMFISGFNNTKPVSVVGNEIEIDVLPIPQSYVGQWLPSEKVVLTEEWQPEEKEFRVGDPITRIITLSALGVNEEQLPEIEVQYPDSVKTYPDQSTLHSATRDNKIIAQRRDSMAIVPSRPGPLTMPEVKIPWFNSNTNQMEYATLPAKTFEIREAVPTAGSPAPTTIPTATAPLQPTGPVEFKEVPVNSWMTWSFLAAWLVTLMAWFTHVRLIKGKTQKKESAQSSNVATSGRTYWAAFEKACKADDGQNAANELIRWAKARWPEQSFNSVMAVAQFLQSQQVIDAVSQMQKAMYSNGSSKWQGQGLLKAVAANKNPKTDTMEENLKPLHPV